MTHGNHLRCKLTKLLTQIQTASFARLLLKSIKLSAKK